MERSKSKQWRVSGEDDCRRFSICSKSDAGEVKSDEIVVAQLIREPFKQLGELG